MKINLFIFDWSGVISDDRRPVYKANMQVLKDYGKPTMSFDEWLPRTTLTPVKFFENHGIRDDSTKLFKLYERYLTKAVKSGIVPTVYPDVHNVIQYLKKEKGKKIAVLSSHPVDNLRKEAEQYKLTPLLDFIFGNSNEKAADLLYICGRLGEHAEFALYTGDTIYDIKAAKNASIHSACVCTGYHVKERLKKEGPELIFNSLSDLKIFF